MLVATSISFAQADDDTYSLTSSDGVMEFVDGVEAGGRSAGLPNGKRQYAPIIIRKRIDKASPLLARAASSLSGGPIVRAFNKLHRLSRGKKSKTYQQGAVSYVEGPCIGLDMPAMDAQAKDPAYMVLKFDVDATEHLGFPEVTQAEKEGAKKQKLWTASAFRFAAEGVSETSVSHIDPFSLRVVQGDLDGDGEYEPLTRCSNIAITIPIEQAGQYVEWINEPTKEEPKPRMIRIGVNDDDGREVLIFELLVVIKTVSFADIFLGDQGFPGREVNVVFEVQEGKKGLNAVNVKLA